MRTIRPLCPLLVTLSLVFAPVHAQEPALDTQARQQGVPVEDLRTFAAVMEQIRSSYIEEVDDRTLLQAAIRGMLAELDPHSAYLDAAEFSDLQINTSGEFGGLGVEVTMENGFLEVVAPIDDTPASRAGLEAGDLILKVDDTFVKGLSLSEAVQLMRGKIGTDVELSILSAGDDKPRKVTLTRARIQIESVRAEMLMPGFGYLRITQFQNQTAREAEKAVRDLLEKEGALHGLVLDLRNNPGGVLTAAVKVSDLFLDQGLVVYTQGRDESSRTDYAATPGDILDGRPLVVLVNGGSASASEIVAGALQDQERAVVVGQPTFGKGSVQSVLPIQEDRALKLTTALYYTPGGRSIQAEGIKPDIITEVATVELADVPGAIRERDLRGHLENGHGAEAEEVDTEEAPLAVRDYPLYEALSILKGMHLAGRASQAGK